MDGRMDEQELGGCMMHAWKNFCDKYKFEILTL